MSAKRFIFVGGGLALLIPSVAGASGATTAGCVSVPVALGLAFLPPEAITDYARDRLLGEDRED